MDKQLIEKIKTLIKKAGKIALDCRECGLQIERKSDNSPVTNADKKISLFLYENLSNITPDLPIICEEREPILFNKNKTFWLIDPIDGTRSYINNQDSFTVNMAIIDNMQAIYGFIYQPATDVLYFTDQNQQFCMENGNDMPLKANVHNQDGFVAVVSSRNFNQKTAIYLKTNSFSEIIAIPSSIKLCMVAEGACDVYPKFGPTMEWDIAAGHALIKAAGGEIWTFNGTVMNYAKENFENPEFIAAGKRWKHY
jgi:3'(2'), 5'-bisphosphate nucleotidase